MSFPRYPAYKDSGVEWLGEVPQNWSVYSLKRTVDGCVNGLWGDEPDGENDIAVIRVADFERSFSTVGLDKLTYRSITPKERQSRLIKSGDLLIEKSGGGEKTLVGCVVLFKHEFDAITSNFVARMRPLAEFDSQFLCYAFGNLYHGRVNYPSVKQVTGIQNLDAESYLQERFCFPALVKQTQIARFLDHETARIDALIEEQQRLIELLKEKRQAVISHSVTKGLDTTVLMKDSGVEWLGEVPAHWEVIALKRLARKITDGEHISPQFTDEGMPFLSAKNIRDRVVEYNVEKYVSLEDGLRFRRRCNPEINDVLIVSRGATIGRVGLVEQEVIFCLLGSVILLKAKSDITDPVFIYYMLNQSSAQEQFQLASQASAQQAIYLVDVAELSVVLPPLEEQIKIRESLELLVGEVNNLIDVANDAIALMQERRSALISAAVTGKIDVRGWQPPASVTTPELVQEAV